MTISVTSDMLTKIKSRDPIEVSKELSNNKPSTKPDNIPSGDNKGSRRVSKETYKGGTELELLEMNEPKILLK